MTLNHTRLANILFGCGVSLFFIVLSGCVSASQIEREPLFIQNVHTVTDKPKKDIHDAARVWISLNFQDSKAVIEVDDQETGKIIGRGIIKVSSHGFEWPVRFTLIIESKDGKFRSTYRDFEIGGSGGHWVDLFDDPDNRYKTKAKGKILLLDEALMQYILNPTVGNNDW